MVSTATDVYDKTQLIPGRLSSEWNENFITKDPLLLKIFLERHKTEL